MFTYTERPVPNGEPEYQEDIDSTQDRHIMNNVFLSHMPSHNTGSQQSVGSAFQRQDSLSMCSKLQEADRLRSLDIMDFMETSMDIDEYMSCLKNLDVPPDTVDLDDNELQKGNLLYDDRVESYDPYGHHEELLPQHSGNPSLGSITPSATPMSHANLVKTEPRDWDVDPPSTSATPVKRRARDMSRELESYKPSTKARKYNLKPEEEKNNPGYQLKRARNNDAVRKSRSKAKELQQKRAHEMEELRKENERLKTELETARMNISELKKVNIRLANSSRRCTCHK